VTAHLGAAAQVATCVVAAAHVVFMILESVLWTTPTGRRIFAQSPESAETTRVLALNQGLYNGGLAALLVWSVATGRAATAAALLVFVIAMGIVGAVTAKPTILVAQALPAAVALALVLL
jgi:putative membrane protein